MLANSIFASFFRLVFIFSGGKVNRLQINNIIFTRHREWCPDKQPSPAARRNSWRVCTHVGNHWNISTLRNDCFDMAWSFGPKKCCNAVANHFGYGTCCYHRIAARIIPPQIQRYVRKQRMVTIHLRKQMIIIYFYLSLRFMHSLLWN